MDAVTGKNVRKVCQSSIRQAGPVYRKSMWLNTETHIASDM